MTFIPTTNLDYGAQLDASGRLRVSQLLTQIDIKQIYDDAPLFYDRENVNGATQVWQSTDQGTEMSVTNSGDAAICQTKMAAQYFSGKSLFGEITFQGYENVAGVTKRAGYFCSNTTTPFDSNKEGLWFEADGTDYRLRVQKDGVDILNVAQSSWNLDTATWLDPSKFNVFVFQFLWLGGTAVRFGFVNEGVITWVHQYNHAGLVSSTFIGSPNKPVRYEIRSSGGSGTCTQICTQIASEGSQGEVGIHRGINLGDTAPRFLDANSTSDVYALLGIRLDSSKRFVRVDEKSFSLIAATNDDFVWEMRLNPTVSGTFTYSALSNSSVEVAYGDKSNDPSTNTVTGGTVVSNGVAEGNRILAGDLNSALRMGSTIAGVMDEYVLCVRPLTTNLDICAAMNFQEFI